MLITLVVGVAGGLAIPYRVLEGVIPPEWLPAVGAANATDSTPSARASASASAAAPEPEPEPEPEPTLEEKAAKGDAKAMKELEALPDGKRTVEQNTALARGEVAQRVELLEKIAKRVKKEPAFADEPATLSALLGFARDPHTSFRALEVIASQKRAATNDLLFEIWTGVPDRTPATVLAERLLTSEEIRKHSSPALMVTLDLRDVDSCDTVMDLIARTEEVGDRRAIRSLAKLTSRRDCGDNGNEECFPCLRETAGRKALANAARSAQKRPAPDF